MLAVSKVRGPQDELGMELKEARDVDWRGRSGIKEQPKHL
jgi:hypothetical protein